MQGVALFRAVLELGIATDYGQADAGNKEADLAALFPKIQAALLQAKADLATIAGSSLPPEVQPFFARLQQAADQSPEAVDMSDDPIRSRVTATNRALEDRFSFDTYPGAVGLVSAAKANPKVCPDW